MKLIEFEKLEGVICRYDISNLNLGESFAVHYGSIQLSKIIKSDGLIGFVDSTYVAYMKIYYDHFPSKRQLL